MSKSISDSILKAAIMRPGRKENTLIKARIYNLLLDHGPLYAQLIKKLYLESFDEGVGWNTIRKYLQRLMTEGSISVKSSISMGARGEFVIYQAELR